MSTILKALRRLEQEKAAEVENRPLREEVAHVEIRSAASSTRWWPTTLALIFGLAAGAGAFTWWSSPDRDAAPQVASPAPVVAPVSPPVAPRVEPPPRGARPEPIEAGLPGHAFSSKVEVVSRPDAQPRISDASPVVPINPPKLGQRRPVEDSSAARRARQAIADAAASAAPGETPALMPMPDQIAQQAVSPQAVRKAPVARTAPAPAPLRRVEPKPAPAPVVAAKPKPVPAPQPKPQVAPAPKPAPAEPRVAALKPEATKPKPAPQVAKPAPEPAAEALPVLYVEKTLWHPQASRRRAWLRLEGGESQSVVEGDTIGGLKVAEIKPSGVLLERDGKQFSRGLGSSGNASKR